MTQPPFWHPALLRAEIWRTLLGFVLIVAIFAGVAVGIFLGGSYLLHQDMRQLFDGATPAAAALFFLPFVGFHIALLIVLPLLHKRRYASLFGPYSRLNLRHFRFGLYVTGAMALVYAVAMFIEQVTLPEALRPTLVQINPFGRWLMLLPLMMPVILLQTLAEELIFRGYLLQQLHARFRSVWIWAVLPSVLFGALHFDPVTYGTNAYFYVLNTSVAGILACLITIRTGNLGAAAGLHFANNMLVMIMGIVGELEGFTLFGMIVDQQSGYMTWSLLFQTGQSVVVFILWWRWMNRHRPIANPSAHD